MATNKAVPCSLKDFLDNGIETVACSICTEPFSDEHVAVQIKQCGHQFGKHCLEIWLRQKILEGTCPLCRGVLFKSKKSLAAVAGLQVAAPVEPFSPQVFYAYYEYGQNMERSIRTGFMNTLWHNLYHMDRTGGPTLQDISTVITQAFDATNSENVVETPSFQPGQIYEEEMRGPEHYALSPYVYRIRHTNFAFPDECPISNVAHTFVNLASVCTNGNRASEGALRAVLLFHIHFEYLYPALTWTGLRDAAWALRDPQYIGRAVHMLWPCLYLFLWLMTTHREHARIEVADYKIKEVRALLRTLDFGFPTDLAQTRDTGTRLFLSAAAYVLELSSIDGESAKRARSLRLMSSSTDIAHLKQDVEGIWLEGVALGADEVAVGFPDSWWLGV